MRILRFDGTGGASGDMILGALTAVGAPLDAARKAVAALKSGDITICADTAVEQGISGIRIRVEVPEPHEPASHRSAHSHAHGHRSFAEIRGMISGAGIGDSVKSMSLAVFQRLADAEGRIHGIPPDRVTFHEVGAADSIADIVGSCALLDALNVDRVECAPLPLGHGEVHCAHGVYPLPAPAVVELLKGFPVHRVDETCELVTPTGAALLVEWCAHGVAPAPAPTARRMVAAGYGLGRHALHGRANVLRASLHEAAIPAASESDRVCVLECEMDDCTGEWAGELASHLMSAGALDAYVTPVQMKKQRPGFLLTVLARPEDAARLGDIIFERGTTFGVREYECSRRILAREIIQVTTSYGPVRVKMGVRGGLRIIASPEMEDCVALAAKHAVSPREVYLAAQTAARIA